MSGGRRVPDCRRRGVRARVHGRSGLPAAAAEGGSQLPAVVEAADAYRRRRSLSEVPSNGTVLYVDGRGVAQDHLGAAPAAGSLDGGGRGAAADQFRGEAPSLQPRERPVDTSLAGP